MWFLQIASAILCERSENLATGPTGVSVISKLSAVLPLRFICACQVAMVFALRFKNHSLTL